MEEEHSDSNGGVRQGWGGIMHLQNNLDRGPCPTSSLSDENQNRLTENGQDEMDGSLQTGWTPSQQDSENNNEEEDRQAVRLLDNYGEPLAETLRAETPDSPQHSTWLTIQTGSNAVSERFPPVGPADSVSSCLDQTSGSTRGGEPLVPRPSPSPVAFLQDLVERSDYTLLPQCLHQIAEDFFLEENYEWAVQFLKLERDYHQRLLSNLARLQEQWESRQKGGSPAGTSSTGTLGAGLEAAHMEMLRRICRTHQRSTLRDKKCITVDKALRDSLISRKPALERKPNTVPLSCCSDSSSESPGRTGVLRMEDASVTQHAVDSTDLVLQQEASSTSTLHHWEEMLHSATVIPASNKTGRHCPDDSVSVGGVAIAESPNNARLDATLGSLLTDSSLHPEEAEENQTDLVRDLPESVQRVEGCDTWRTSGPAEASQDGAPETGEVAAAGDEDEGGAAAGPSGEMSSAGPNWLGEEKEETGSSMEPTYSEEAEGGEEKPEIVEVEVSEESNELEDNGYGVDVAGDGQAEEAGEAPHDSLDDLAKRIQVEEITPASGLVSILKRRTSPEVISAPAPPKQTSKRKVRFREPDEVPDQDEVGSDSWLLLLLLCLATVVISVGGTALYCALGDVQSSVCTDFSRNVDFYFSQAQRGLDELRHWLSPGPL
ncbi:consortin isoform X2 [Brienomyrus brachyistius]|uniref:consortin isoform X2 n=1 Tax=Brienomyrus brachyistius TaxID=42636 RepID=UPI0020B31047|nr:consortin isoform X2 [Brienomyrus brachyistius]